MLQTGLCKHFLVLSFVLAAALIPPFADAQVTTTGIRGTVKDTTGGSIPKAALKLVDSATGLEKQAVAGEDGSFVFVNMQAGSYKLTATAQGFQAVVVDQILADSGRTTDITVLMKVGTMTETVEVAASGVQLETTSNEVGTTINSSSIKTLPYDSRDALNFTLLMPGVQQSGGRNNTFNGLPNASLNISLDGMNNNSQRFKSGGTSFFEFAPARLDAIEEVTVSTTGLGADASGQGAMQMRFTTKRGTDRYHFHVLEQMANEDFNANTYFNILKGIHRSKTRTTNYSGNAGGPLLPFIHAFKGKLFFFVNFEDLPQPGASPISTTVLQPEAYTGNFTYAGTDGVNHTVNLLTAVGAVGCATCRSTIDPTVAGLLNGIKATQSSGAVSGYLPIAGVPYEQTMLWNFANDTETQYPTARIDYQFLPKMGYHGTWNLRHQNTIGNPNYPGGPVPANNAYKITTYVVSNVFDWTITPHLLNNATFGIQSNLEYFYNPSDPHQWAAYGDRNISLGITNPQNTQAPVNPLIPNITPFSRNNPVYQFTDNLTWIRGKHTLTLGGSILHTSFYEQSYNDAGILNTSFGVSGTDPVSNIIQAALPAINLNNTADLNNAKQLYAVLTGRIGGLSTSYNVDENTHQYVKFAPAMQRFAHNTAGLYMQDSWRIRPNLTINYGMRWELDGPVYNTNGVDTSPGSLYGPSTAQFQPGVLNGDLNPQLTLIPSSPWSVACTSGM